MHIMHKFTAKNLALKGIYSNEPSLHRFSPAASVRNFMVPFPHKQHSIFAVCCQHVIYNTSYRSIILYRYWI